MLMLDHKGLPYQRVDLITGLHPLAVRMLGFPGKAQRTNQLGESSHRRLAMLDRLGTVPALLMYRVDLEPQIASRPAGALVDRVLPA